jgi:hypothetical protein
MGIESDHLAAGITRQVIARDDGWFVVGPEGSEIAGPFANLDDVEDYLDSQDARSPKQPDPPVESVSDPVAARGAEPRPA